MKKTLHLIYIVFLTTSISNLLNAQIRLDVNWGHQVETGLKTDYFENKNNLHRDFGNQKRPKWNVKNHLSKLNSVEKKQIVEDAWQNTIDILKKCEIIFAFSYTLCFDQWCEESSSSYYINDINEINLNRQFNHFAPDSLGTSSCFSHLLFSIKYSENDSETEHYSKHFFSRKFFEEVIYQNSAKVMSITREREYFDVRIDIYLENLGEAGVFILNPDSNEKGYWASDPVEAVTYIILYEIGKFEYYLFHNAESYHIRSIRQFNKYDRDMDPHDFALMIANEILTIANK